MRSTDLSRQEHRESRSGSSGLRISRRLAYFFGVATPLAETVRRWGTWWDDPPAFIDDWLLGAFLVAGAWATRGDASARARALLAGAWGFACGMAYSSAAFQWFAMRSGEPDPSGLPGSWVFAVKVGGGLLFLTALFLTVASEGVEPAPPGSSRRSRVGG